MLLARRIEAMIVEGCLHIVVAGHLCKLNTNNLHIPCMKRTLQAQKCDVYVLCP